MQKESGWWRNIGARFEEFKPRPERRFPTEWLIPFYAIRRLLWWSGREVPQAEQTVKIDKTEETDESDDISDAQSDAQSSATVDDRVPSGADPTETEERPKVGLFSRLCRGRGKKETESV
jgi:hypothetical protein